MLTQLITYTRMCVDNYVYNIANVFRMLYIFLLVLLVFYRMYLPETSE